MTGSETDDLAELLRRRAEREPEEPALFFRGPRGHFTWWSWRRVGAEIDPLADLQRSSAEGGVEGGPRGLLRAAVEPALALRAPAARALLERLGAGPSREIWISSRSLELPAERVVLVAALLAGWVIVREPVTPLPAETFAWARPTVLSGAPAELESLLDGFAALAPRWGASRWRRRRLARLRAVVPDDPERTGGLSSRLAALGASTRIVPLPSPSVEENVVVEPQAEGEPR